MDSVLHRVDCYGTKTFVAGAKKNNSRYPTNDTSQSGQFVGSLQKLQKATIFKDDIIVSAFYGV